MLCHESANGTEQTSIKLNNMSMARALDQCLFLLPSCLGWHTTWQRFALAVRLTFLRNSITLRNEQPALVDRMGFRVRAIHCTGNVSHFHEYWMECATVGRRSLSLWFVFFLPPPPHLDYNLLPRTRCTLLKTDFCPLLLSVWVRSIPGQALQRMMSDYAHNMHHHKILG